MLLGTLLATATACAGRMTLMPPPVMVRDGIVDVFGELPASYRTAEIPVFYATDRAPGDVAQCEYSVERGDVLRLGVATTHFGEEDWDFDELARRSSAGAKVHMDCVRAEEFGRLWTTISPADPERYGAARASVSPADRIRAPAHRFAAAVDERLAASVEPDIYVFVAGYNTTFHETVNRIGQFGHFVRDGVYLAYSWPTRGGALGYVEDAQNGALSVRNLRELLIFLAQSTRVRRIHLIGYSAGAQVLADALLQLRLLNRGDDAAALQQQLRIGRVLYPAPDLDVMYARNLELDALSDLAEASTIYVSREDSALWASARLLFNAPRLGRPENALTEADLEKLRGETLNAFVDPGQAERSAGRSDRFGHAYWYGNSWVSTDALLFLRHGLAPAERGLVRSESGTYWVFPEDYPVRLREVLWDLERRLREERARQLPTPARPAPARRLPAPPWSRRGTAP